MSASNTVPAQVYFGTSTDSANGSVQEHSTLVAGIMIGNAQHGAAFEGVAPAAFLHSSGFDPTDETDVFLAAQFLALRTGTDANGGSIRMRAINISWVRELDGIISFPNGQTQMSKFFDWSGHAHDLLYITAWGNDDSPTLRTPADSYNDITVAASGPVEIITDPAYRRFSSAVNALDGDAEGDRTTIDILAPGEAILALGPGDNQTVVSGSSAAAPHVTGAVALLQQYAEPKVIAGTDPRWVSRAQVHEVMKAVMMNSADKLAGVHGSTRTVLDKDGNDWTQSPAFGNDDIPLDQWMGSGHLNVSRALQQYQPGEYDPGPIPKIGWDFHPIGGSGARNEYVFDSEIGGGYIAVTLAWDRRPDKTGGGNYSVGDQFVVEPINQQMANLDLYLMPADSNDLMDALDASKSEVQNVEHIFFDIPEAGEYKLIVVNNQVNGTGTTDTYALAWWFGNPSPPGDHNGDGNVDIIDYVVWRSSDGSEGGYDDWSGNYGTTSGTGSGASAVPEPGGLVLASIAILMGSGGSPRPHGTLSLREALPKNSS